MANIIHVGILIKPTNITMSARLSFISLINNPIQVKNKGIKLTLTIV